MCKEKKYIFLRCATVCVIFNHRTYKGLLVYAQYVGPQPRIYSNNGFPPNSNSEQTAEDRRRNRLAHLPNGGLELAYRRHTRVSH